MHDLVNESYKTKWILRKKIREYLMKRVFANIEKIFQT